MKIRIFMLVAIILGYCLWGYGPVSGGECPSGPEYYLRCLEGEDPVGLEDQCPEPFLCFGCVGILRQEFERWVSGREARRFREFRDISYHDRLVGLAQKYLDDPKASDATRRAAAEALAFQGVRHLGTNDVFSLLVGEPDQKVPLHYWYVLAALGDPRTVERARGEYVRLKQIDPAADRLAQPTLLNIIDCLYHIPGEAAPDLLRELSLSETNAELRDELGRVVWKRSKKK